MLYYRVKRDKNDCIMIKIPNTSSGPIRYQLIPGELYTPRETKILGFSEKDIEKYLEKAEVKKSKIYWCFGCRWEEIDE